MKPSFSLKWLFVGAAAVGLLITAVLHSNRWFVFASCLVMVGLCSFSAFRGLLHGWRAPFSLGFAITALFCYSADLPRDAVWLINPANAYIEDDNEVHRRMIGEHIFTFLVSSVGGIAASYYAFRWSVPEVKPKAKP
ncbi:MAG: hypothetical protein U0836_16990 [Pirellulales bacterium]